MDVANAPSLAELKLTDPLHVNCSDAALAKTSDGATSPVTSCSSSSGDLRNTFVCDVCFDECERDKLVDKICGPTCSATMCSACTHSYVNVQTLGVIPGVLAKMNCPVCIVPVNIVRWRRRLASCETGVHNTLDDYCSKIERSCDVKCPSCHLNRCLLPRQSSGGQMIKLPPPLAAHIPRLREVCHAFCNYQVTASDVIAFAQATFGDAIGTSVVETLVPLIHDTERRASLYLRLRRLNPFIRTKCCNAPVCFSCLVAGHHEGVPCRGVSPNVKDAIVECKSCGLHLVKGDGCDSVQCYCGRNFAWSSAIIVTKMRCLEPRHLAALRALVPHCRHLVLKRRFYRQVVAKVPEVYFAARAMRISANLAHDIPLKSSLRYHISRWAQRVRMQSALDSMMSAVVTMQAKAFWKLRRETHADELHDLDDERSLLMAIEV